MGGHIDTPWDMQLVCHVLVFTFTTSFKQGAGRGAVPIRPVGAPLVTEDGATLGMTPCVRAFCDDLSPPRARCVAGALTLDPLRRFGGIFDAPWGGNVRSVPRISDKRGLGPPRTDSEW